MWMHITIAIIVGFLAGLCYNKRRLVIRQGLPHDPKFYEGWNTEPLTTIWLNVSHYSIMSLFTQNLETSYYGTINDIPVGMTGTTPLDEYYEHFDSGVQKISENVKSSDDDRKFVMIHLKAKGIINSYIREHSLGSKKKFHNSGLMVLKAYHGQGIGRELMKHKLRELNSIVFTSTTNKYSARVMEQSGFKLIESLKYSDLNVSSNDTFNVYVWTPIS